MKLQLILAIFLIALAAGAAGQRRRQTERCAGRPRNPSCSGGLNRGRRGLRCGARNMFYYDAETRQCRPMRYRGCGGNSNRWCSASHCQRRCFA